MLGKHIFWILLAIVEDSAHGAKKCSVRHSSTSTSPPVSVGHSQQYPDSIKLNGSETNENPEGSMYSISPTEWWSASLCSEGFLLSFTITVQGSCHLRIIHPRFVFNHQKIKCVTHDKPPLRACFPSSFDDPSWVLISPYNSSGDFPSPVIPNILGICNRNDTIREYSGHVSWDETVVRCMYSGCWPCMLGWDYNMIGWEREFSPPRINIVLRYRQMHQQGWCLQSIPFWNTPIWTQQVLL